MGDSVFPADLLAAAERVHATCGKRSLTVATAESCTGGLLAALLTEMPGSSRTFLGGVSSYSNETKQLFLGVNASLIEREGAVSAAVAGEMARGVRCRTGADLAVSITGIAGPGGARPGKPVGLVWFGTATQGHAGARRDHAEARQSHVETTSRHFEGADRQAVRLSAVRVALGLLQELAERA